MKFRPPQEAPDARGDFNKAIREFQTDKQVLSTAFVREFFQNALDAVLDTSKKVTVKFRLVDVQDKEDQAYLKGIYGDILGVLAVTGTEAIQNNKYLVIDEYNTKGLTGTSKFRPLDNELGESHWSNFSFGLLRESKEGDSGGRNGVGKIMLNLLSGLRAVIYKTLRSDDGEEWIGGRVEFNKPSFLGNENDRVRYSDWAWLTSTDEEVGFMHDEKVLDKFYAPTTSKSDIEKLNKIFGIHRDDKDFGTSWIIPSPLEKNTRKDQEQPLKNLQSLLDHTIESFSWAFMSNFLEVDFDGEIVNSENIVNILNDRFPNKEHVWSFLDDVRTFPDDGYLDVHEFWQEMSLENLANDDITNPTKLKNLAAKFNDNEVVGFRFPIDIKRKTNPNDPSRKAKTEIIKTNVKVFLQNPDLELLAKEEFFLRKYLIISGEKSLNQSSKALAVTLIDDVDLSTFCAYAESTDHTQFVAEKFSLKQRYVNTQKTLALLRKAAKTAFQTLNITDNKRYDDILAEILGVSVASGIKRKTKRKRKKVLVTPNPNPTPKGQKYVEIGEGFNPIIVRPGNDPINPDDCPMKITLNCSTVRLLKGTTEFDMGEKGFLDLQLLKNNNCTHTVLDNSSLMLEITDPDFYIELAGFSSKFRTSISIKY